MPDDQGKLSKEELAAAGKWIGERANLPCAVCRHTSWVVGEHVVSLIADAKNVLGTKQHYPALVVVCANCAHIRLHSAMRAGIVKINKDGSEEKEAKNGK